VVDKKDAGDLLPDDGDVLITCENGKIKKTRIVHSDEHVATLNALFELAKLTGYTNQTRRYYAIITLLA
jgi:hypothetical protein